MSINQENYPLADPYPDLTSPSSLYHTLPALHYIHHPTNHPRIPLQHCLIISPNIIPHSPQELTILPTIKPLVSLANKRSAAREPDSTPRLSDQLRNYNKKPRFAQKGYKGFPTREDLVSPIGMEPESSSSQPSEPFSGTYRDFSPFQLHSEPLRKQGNFVEDIFPEALYNRVEEFLDNEGLDVVDPGDWFVPVKIFSQMRETKSSGDEDRAIDDICEMKNVRSATQSPRLLSEHICCSTLFQRRASRSQSLSEEELTNDTFNGLRPGKLNIFKHFQDDVNQIMMTASPIEEKDTPVLSLNNSEYQANTPNRIGSGRVSIKQMMSPEPIFEAKEMEEVRPLSRLMKYTVKHSRSFKSPLLDVRLKHQNSIEFSPIHNFKEEKVPSSVSPTLAVSHWSLKSKDVVVHKRKGEVVRKSRFQKLQGFLE